MGTDQDSLSMIVTDMIMTTECHMVDVQLSQNYVYIP